MLICPSCSRKYRNGFDQCSEDDTQLVPYNGTPTIAAGTTLENGPTIQHMLGSGPTGEIYKAKHKGRTITVKLLSPELAEDQTYCQQLSRLLNHLGKVRHIGVAQPLSQSLTYHLGRPWFAQEPVSGQSLSEVIRRSGPMVPERAIPIAQRIAEALTEAHRAGSLHLNIKPSNVFLGANDSIILVDFGIGARFELDGRVLYGEPRFMAPEQFDGKLVSFRSDIYGVGALLFFLLTAQPPFNGSKSEVAQAVANQPAPAPSSVESTLSGNKNLDQLVLRALEKMPAKRFLSVQHFGRMMDGLVITVRRSSRIPNPRASSSTTLPYGGQPMLSPGIGKQLEQTSSETPEISDTKDTIRMAVPPEIFAPKASSFSQPQTEPKKAPYTPPHLTPPKTPMPFPYQPQVDNHKKTLKMAVPPVPQKHIESEQISINVEEPQDFADPQPPTNVQPPLLQPPMPRPLTLEPVPQEKAPRPKRRKRRKRKVPIVAVRGEAALLLGPEVEVSQLDEPSDAVVLDSNFMEEARGPERNLQTMEIHLRPGALGEDPDLRGTQKKRKGSLINWIFAILVLVLIFVVAAIAAATIARLFHPGPIDDTPSQSAPLDIHPPPPPPAVPTQ